MIDILIEKKIETLPQNLQDSIKKFNWIKILPEITQKHHLHIDQVNIYKRELLLNLLGMNTRETLMDSFKRHLHISQEAAQKLVQESNTFVFKPIREVAFDKENINEGDEHFINLDDEDHMVISNNLQETVDTYIPKYKRTQPKQKTKKPEATTTKQYHEPIELSDLAGITKHRTPYTYHKSEAVPQTNLSKKLYEQPFTAKGSIANMSPSPLEETIEREGFLKQFPKTNTTDIEN